MLINPIKASPLGPDPELSFEGLIDYQANADTLLRCDLPSCGGGYDCTGLTESSIEIQNIPNHPQLRVLHARLSWAASSGVLMESDQEVTLHAPNMNQFSLVADPLLSESFQDGMPQCQQLIPLICPEAPVNLSCDLKFYANHVDLTQTLNAYLADGGTLNGAWSISDIEVVGSSINDPATAIASIGSLSIGAWSLIIIYESPNLTPRKIYYYQGLELNEGINRQIFPQGFVAPADPVLDLSLMILEGDQSISGDQLLINGRQISDACNPVNNIFNSTVNVNGECRIGVTGVDLDRFEINNAIEAGDEEARLELVIPQGDGLFTAGEQLFTHWMILAFDHLLPDFDGLKPEKKAIPPHESMVIAGDTIEYSIQITNRGQAAASQVKLTDPLSSYVAYIPGSLRIDNQVLADGPNQSFALSSGLILTDLPQVGSVIEIGQNHLITFQVHVLPTVLAGDTITNTATIEADLIDPIVTNQVQHIVSMNGNAGTESGTESGTQTVAGEDSGTMIAGIQMMAGTQAGDTAGTQAGDTTISGEDAGAWITGGTENPESGTMINEDNMGNETQAGARITLEDRCGAGTRFNQATEVCESICGLGLRWDATCDPGVCVQESEPPCDASEIGSSDQGGCKNSSSSTIPFFLFITFLLLTQVFTTFNSSSASKKNVKSLY
jgi:uncharacterized repeat protein (TIGR01451 family)